MFNVLHAGGNWDNSAPCGSRGRNANNSRSNRNANYSGRRSIRGKNITNSGLPDGASLLTAEHVTLAQCQNTKRR